VEISNGLNSSVADVLAEAEKIGDTYKFTPEQEEELFLYYVAVTRAKYETKNAKFIL